MRPMMKHGTMESKVFLGYVRRLPCSFCDAEAPSSAHHFPPRGRGVTDDSKTCPVCARCHMRCHGQRVDGGEPIDEERQRREVDRVRSRFLETATAAEMDAFMADWRRWREGRLEMVAW